MAIFFPKVEHAHEFFKADLAVIVSVHLLDHVLENIVREVRIVDLQQLRDFVLRNDTVVIHIEKVERLNNHIEILVLLLRILEQLSSRLSGDKFSIIN
jgi:hypothetical protein